MTEILVKYLHEQLSLPGAYLCLKRGMQSHETLMIPA